MEIQECTTQELIDEIVARNECKRIGYYLEIDDCGFSDEELKEELEWRGYNVVVKNELSDTEVAHTEEADDDEVRRDFERSRTAALEVLQDLLGMQHTTTKEQVIEKLKQIL